MPPLLLETRDGHATLDTIRSILTPYPAEQQLTLYVLAGLVGISIVICMAPVAVQLVLHPWILFDTAIHEFCHALAITLTGGNVQSIEIKISGAGVTCGCVRGRASILVLPAGHLGSATVSASLVFAGFSILASKIASLALAAIMITSLVWLIKDRVSIPTTFFAVIVIVPLWLLWHARPLRFYVLFVGAVTFIHNIVIMIQTQFLQIPPGSDVDQFARATCGSPRLWGSLWIFLAFLLFAGAVLGGIAAFHQDINKQYYKAARFLPT